MELILAAISTMKGRFTVAAPPPKKCNLGTVVELTLNQWSPVSGPTVPDSSSRPPYRPLSSAAASPPSGSSGQSL